MCIDLMQLLESDMNFTVRLFKRFDGVWASKDLNTGIWNGIASNLISGDADVAFTTLALTTEKYEVMDYMDPMADMYYGFAIKSECDFDFE